MDSANATSEHILSGLPMGTTAIVGTMVVLLSYYYYTDFYTYFKKRGLNGPTPLPLLGNMHTLLTTDRWVLERKWSEQYGKFYGVFNGSKPRFVINDPEVLQQICIKDFAAMPNHESSSLLNHYQKEFIFFTQDDHWRRLRALQSPTFTSGKIKRMYKLLDWCADDLVLNFSEHLDDHHRRVSEAIVNLRDIYSLYTMDAITTAAYSIKLDRKVNTTAKQNNKSTRDDFVALAMQFFEFRLVRVLIAFTVPRWLLNAVGFKIISASYCKDFEHRLKPIVNQRRTSSKKFDDYLQILIDARIDDHMELDELDEKENHHAGLTKESLETDRQTMIKNVNDTNSNGGPVKSSADDPKIKLTDHEIISSAIFLLIVGLETTATLLTHCSYALAFHPDVQEKLYQTIKSIAEFNAEKGEYTFDYEKLTSCEYLDAVISEALRLLAPVISLDRVVSQDYYVEKYGVKLRKGDKLNLAYYAIMNNPEFWPEPSKFDPERFVGDNKKNIVPGSYCPFGLGPRHCLGMRFSLTEAKLALAKVLMKFRFSPAPNTNFPPTCKRSLGLSRLQNPSVKLMAR